MENEIKVGEWVRTDNGIIGKYVKYRGIEDSIETDKKWIGFDIEKDIVKHSLNLIDLIQCGDYVNGYKVDDIEKRKLIIGNTTRAIEQIVENDEIETVVTKEQFESISYKVWKKKFLLKIQNSYKNHKLLYKKWDKF